MFILHTDPSPPNNLHSKTQNHKDNGWLYPAELFPNISGYDGLSEVQPNQPCAGSLCRRSSVGKRLPWALRTALSFSLPSERAAHWYASWREWSFRKLPGVVRGGHITDLSWCSPFTCQQGHDFPVLLRIGLFQEKEDTDSTSLQIHTTPFHSHLMAQPACPPLLAPQFPEVSQSSGVSPVSWSTKHLFPTTPRSVPRRVRSHFRFF